MDVCGQKSIADGTLLLIPTLEKGGLGGFESALRRHDARIREKSEAYIENPETQYDGCRGLAVVKIEGQTNKVPSILQTENHRQIHC